LNPIPIPNIPLSHNAIASTSLYGLIALLKALFKSPMPGTMPLNTAITLLGTTDILLQSHEILTSERFKQLIF
jgi:hypothetical protein